MADFITVNMKPAVVDLDGPIKFCTQDVRDNKTLIEILCRAFGPGTLWDSNTVYVSPDSARQLVSGDYTFRVSPPGKDQRDPMLQPVAEVFLVWQFFTAAAALSCVHALSYVRTCCCKP